MLAFLVSALFVVRHPSFFAHHVARFYVNEWQIIGKEAVWCSRLPYCIGGWQDLSLSPSFRLFSSPSLAIASVLSSLFAPHCYLARNPMWAHPHLSNALMVIAKRAAERVYRETVTSTTADRCEIDASLAVLIERLPPFASATSWLLFFLRQHVEWVEEYRTSLSM